ncbi:MAG TPA: peptide deformylase [Firmicutes bacterium]|jgi:peptide deformylase|nr:peptide deformylase [Bacillota bacterium]
MEVVDMVREIALVGDPVLRRPAQPVKKVNAAIRQLLDDMVETMRAAPGVGLAAPQVGVSKRIIVIETEEGLLELINPEVVRSSGREVAMEGCLSVPNKAGEVERATQVTVTGLDRQERRIWVEAQGFQARALQHELDHLDGILFIDRALSLQDLTDEGED